MRNTAPTTIQEWNELCEENLAEQTEKYEAACAEAKANAAAAFDKSLPARKEDLLKEGVPARDIEAMFAREREERIAQAAAMIRQPDRLEQIQALYAFLKPQEMPDMPEMPMPVDLSHVIYSVDAGLYSVAAQAFVEGGQEDISAIIELSPPTLENLRKTLEFYKLPVGSCLLSLEELKSRRLEELSASFEAAQDKGTLLSGAGFEIDATERANRDIQGLITDLEASGQERANFCAADNSFHEVTFAQLKAMRLEVIRYGQALYAKKWAMRSAIEGAASLEAVEAVKISFAEA